MVDVTEQISVADFHALQKRYSKRPQNSRKTVVDNIEFDSKVEANRYLELRLLERAGDISHLSPHPAFVIQERGKDKWSGKVISKRTYTADFKYWDAAKEHWVVEDVKGKRKTKAGNVVPKVSRDFYMRWDTVRLLYQRDIEFMIVMR